jgi:hypothetical protein
VPGAYESSSLCSASVWVYADRFNCSWGTYTHRYTEVCAVSYPMARMQLAMMATIQAQRTPLAAIHRGVGARQVKVKLYEARKLIWRKHRLVLLFIESSLMRSGE